MNAASRLIASASALLVITACAISPPSNRPDHPQVLLLMVEGGGFGSGVVIADDWIVTCAHCVPVAFAGDLPATHQIPHPFLDLALVKVPGVKSNGLRFGSSPKLYDRLFAYGFHLADHFLKTEGYQGGRPDLMSCPIIHGCSGGAVVDSRGDLVGIIAYVIYTGTANGFDGYALPHISGYTPIGDTERQWIADQIELNTPAK